LTALSSNGAIVAQLVGDFATFTAAPVLSTKRLLIPSTPGNDARVLAGTSAWMLVDNTQIDLSGGTCDKIGVSYKAFNNQNNACLRLPNTCLSNQPDDLYTVLEIRTIYRDQRPNPNPNPNQTKLVANKP
jgi:hypothetical protein